MLGECQFLEKEKLIVKGLASIRLFFFGFCLLILGIMFLPWNLLSTSFLFLYYLDDFFLPDCIFVL